MSTTESPKSPLTPPTNDINRYQFDPADPFDHQLIKMRALHRKKRSDYANEDNIYKNFDEVSRNVPIDDYDAFMDCFTMILRKIKRISNLINEGTTKQPQNESFEDSLIDLANYCVLLCGIRRRDLNLSAKLEAGESA
jgi:hypothetical protein